jgi:hypothetical protein
MLLAPWQEVIFNVAVADIVRPVMPYWRSTRLLAGRCCWHFWPFDGWEIPAGGSAVAEVYPALWSRSFARADRTGDQHDAYSVAAWFSRVDQDGSLAAFLKPALTPPERAVARVEGWILGVA